MLKKQKLMFPGDFIAVSEEYSLGKNTFEHEGKIYSSKTGQLCLDEENRRASVKATGKEMLSTGCEVLAHVVRIKPNSVYLHIVDAWKDSKPVRVTSREAVLFIRDVSEEYVEDLADYYRLGDIVRARVVKKDKDETTLTTKGPGLGVVKAFCSKCRHAMRLEGRFLKCYNCNSVEKRKTSSNYEKTGE